MEQETVDEYDCITDVTGTVDLSHQGQSRPRIPKAPSSFSYKTSGASQVPTSYFGNNFNSGNGRLGVNGRHPSFPDDNAFLSDAEKEEQYLPNSNVSKIHYARSEQRTIQMKGLSDRVVHKDIIDIVRGGALLDIYLRANDKSASVSFVEGSAAQAFMLYVKRNDVYIHEKRVSRLYSHNELI